MVVGWHPVTIRKLTPVPRDEEIISFTDFHRLALGLPCIFLCVASYTSMVFASMT